MSLKNQLTEDMKAAMKSGVPPSILRNCSFGPIMICESANA